MTKTAFPRNFFSRIFYSLHHALSFPGRRPLRAALCAVMLAAGASAGAWGATYYWVGGNSGDWSTSSNWNTASDGTGVNGNPSTNDIAIFTGSSAASVTINEAVTISELDFNTAGESTITLTFSTDDLTVSGTTNFGNSGSLTVNKSSNVTLIGNGTSPDDTTGGSGQLITGGFDDNERAANTITFEDYASISITGGSFYVDHTAEKLNLVSSDETGLLHIGSGVTIQDASDSIDNTGVTVIVDGYSVATSVSDTKMTVTVSATAAASTSPYYTVPKLDYYADVTLSVTGEFTLTGTNISSSPITISADSTTPTALTSAAVTGDTSASTSFAIDPGTDSATPSDGDTLTLKIYLQDGFSLIGTVTYTYSSTGYYVWTGSAGTSVWATDSNWSPTTGYPNVNTALVYIPDTTNKPEISSDVTVKSITIEKGATLTVSSSSGMLTGTTVEIENGGTLQIGADSTDSGATADITDVTVDSGGTLEVDGTLNLTSMTLSSDCTTTYGSSSFVDFTGSSSSWTCGSPINNPFLHIKIDGTLTPSSDMYVSGTWTNNGTYSDTSHKVTFTGSSGSIAAGGTSFYNLAVNSSGTVTASTPVAAAGNLTVTAGTLSCTDTLTVSNNLSVTGGSLETDGNLSVTKALSVSSGSLTMDGGSGAQSASAGTCSFTGGTIDFGNNSGDSFTVGSGGIPFPAVLTAVSGAGSITATDSTISLGKNVTLNGALTFKSAVSLTADVSFVTGTSAYGLEFDDNVSCTTYTLETTGTGETTIASSATLSATTGTMTFGGKVTNGGTITGSTGKITFSGDVTNNGTINVPDAGTGSTGVEFDGTYSDSTSGTLVGNTTSNPYLDFKASSVAFRDGGFTANGDIVRFNGTDAQTFTPGSNTFAGVVIDNSAGVSSGALSCSDFTQTSGNTTFSGSLTCSGDITIVDGTLTLGGATSAVSVTIDSDSDNDGKLASNSNTITLSGSWTNNNDGNSGTDGFACGTGTVLFTDNSVLSSITGDNTFYNFTCTTAGKTLTFEGGDTQTIASGGKFTINGQAAGTEITLTSSNTSKWILAVTANPDQVDVSYATVSYAEATDVIISAVTNSAEGVPGTTVNWFNADYYWTGGTDASWDTTSNWKIGSASGSTPSIVPSKDNSSVTITISDSSSTVLTLAAPITAMKKITVDGSQTVDFAGQNVTATDITNNGTVKLAGTQTLTFTNTPVNGTASTVEYTATGNAAPVWHDTGTTTDSYHNLTVDSGCVLQLGSQSVSIDTTNSGVLSNSGTVEIDDTGSINKSDSTTGKFIYSYSGGGTLPALDGYYDLTVSSSPWTVDGDITVNGAMKLTAAVTLNQASAGTVNTLALKGAVSGNYMLTANDVNVDTSFATSITDTSFTFTGDENQSFTPNASLTYPSITVSKTGGTLTVATNALTTAALSVTGGSCTFDRLITVTDTSLTDLTTTGTVAFGAGGTFAGGVTHTAGQTDITGTLTATGKDITLGASDKGIVLTGATVLTTGTDAGTISLEGVVTGSGNQLTLTAGTGDVTASKDIGISSAYIGDFSASGATVTFSGTIYAASTDITGTTSIALDGGSVTTTGTQTYTGDVTFGTDTTLTAYGSSTAQLVTFSGDVTGGTHSLTLGTVSTAPTNVSFGGTVSGITVLDVSGATAVNTSSVTTTGTQTYTGDVTFGTDTTLTAYGSSTAQLVTFSGDVTGGTHSLTLGTVNTVPTNVSFGGTVSGITVLDVSGATAINTSSVTTTGTQTYTGDVTFGTDTTLTAYGSSTAQLVTFSGNVTGGTHSLTLGTVSTAPTNVSFGGTVSGITTLSVSGTTGIASGKTVTTSDVQTYAGDVTNGGTINVPSVATGDAAALFKSAYTGNNGSYLTGSTTTNPYIDFYGDVSMGTFNANGDVVRFCGTGDQAFVPGSTNSYNNISVTNTSGTISIADGNAFVQDTTAGTYIFEVADGAKVTVGTGKFTADTLSVEGAGTFTQTGDNSGSDSGVTYLQSVLNITGTGSVTWDSGISGGYLTLGGCNSTGTVAFNHKNVTITGSATLTGVVFYDLYIPDGVTVTNGGEITVIRNFTLSDADSDTQNGTYTPGSGILYLGGMASSGVASADGTVSDNSTTVQSLGTVVINGNSQTAAKTAATALKIAALTVTDGTLDLATNNAALTVTGTAVNDGTITGSSSASSPAALTFTGKYSGSGTLTATKGTTYFKGDADLSGTAFTANNGTVEFSGSGTSGQTLTINTTSGTSFSTLNIKPSGGAFSVADDTTMILTADVLTVDTTQNVTFGSAVKTSGGTKKVTITAAGTVLFKQSVDADTLVMTQTGGTTFYGSVTVDTMTDAVTAGDITFDGTVSVTMLTGVVFSTTGTVTLGNESSDTCAFTGGVVHTAGNTNLAGTVTTSDKDVSFAAAILTASTVINTGAGAGDILFSSTVTGTTSGTDALTLTAGTGNIELADQVGEEGTYLGDLTIVSAYNVAGDNVSAGNPSVDTGAIYAASLTQNAGTGTTRLGAVTLTGAMALTAEGVGIIGDGTIAATSVTLTGGTVELNGTVTAPSGFSSTGTTFDNTGATITTTAEYLTISHSGTVTIGAALSSGSDSAGDVTVESTGGTIAVSAGVTSGTGAMNISGTGSGYAVTVSGSLNSTTGAVTVSSADTLELENTIETTTGAVLAESVSGTTVSAGGDITTTTGNVTFGASSTYTGTLSTAGNVTTEGADTSGTVTFTNDVMLTGPVAIDTTNSGSSTGGDITFSSKVDSDSTARVLTVTAGNGITAGSGGSVTFSGIIGGSTALDTVSVTGGAITFYGIGPASTTTTAGAASLSVTATGTVTLYGSSYYTSGIQTYTAESEGVRYLGTADGTWHAGDTGIALSSTDLYLDHDGYTLTIGCALSCQNMYFYRGTLSVSSGPITTSNDFVVCGSGYDADDPRYTGSDTRFSYYYTSVPAYYPASASYSSTEHIVTFDISEGPDAAFSFSSAAVTVGGNFYDNGADINGLTLTIPDSSSSSPVFNTGSTITSGQWGTPYAVAFNMTVSNCTVSGGTVAAGSYAFDGTTADTTVVAQTVTDGSNNSGWQFYFPQIVSAETVYDDVLKVTFNMAVENGNGEINTVIAAASGSVSAGGMWYDNTNTAKKFAAAYADPDCTTPPGDTPVTIYLRTTTTTGRNEDDLTTWNTDATGSSAYSSFATEPDDCTNRSGSHSTVIPNLSFLEGCLSAAVGHTMCRNYGTGTEGGTVQTLTDTYSGAKDSCAPVLVAVRIGQEVHDSDPALQTDVDAHNFIEFQYSEPVNIASLTYDGGAANVGATAALGSISGSSGLTVAGLASTTSGAVSTGTSGSYTDSVYRSFATNTTDPAVVQMNRIRVSLAGYVDGTVSVNSVLYNNWIAYIDSATAPSGTVTRISNTSIKDISTSTNGLDASGTTTKHSLPALTVASTSTDSSLDSIYSGWDTSVPSFAPYRASGTTWGDIDEYEVVGASQGSSATLNRIEFHLFDNKPDYTGSDTYSWFSKIGWCSGTGSAPTVPPSYEAADVLGGSRPFDTSEATPGGIRYCTLYNAASAFTYSTNGTTPSVSFDTASDITGGAASPLFYYYAGSGNSTGTTDSLYFSVYLSDSTLPLKTTFTVSYDDSNGWVTDLAGNRLKSATIDSVDRTTPGFSMALGPVGQKKLYVLFSKVLNTSTISYTPDSGATETLNALTYIPQGLELVNQTGGTPSSGIAIDDTKAAVISYSGKAVTALELALTQNITLADVTGLYLRVKKLSSTATDPLLGITGADVTYIQDNIGNYAPIYTAHAFSDFAVNVVNPLYAYDNRLTNGDTDITYGLYSDGSWAVHDWNEDQHNYGTLLTGHDITLSAMLTDGTSSSPAFPYTVNMYLDASPDAAAVSTKYNSQTNSSWRIWLPDVTSDIFTALSSANNSDYITFAGGTIPDSSDPFNEVFNLPVTTDTAYSSWQAGDQISFLFGINDSDGNPVTIIHSPEADDSSGSSYSGTSMPLYALRLKDSSDITSLDLWSFKLKDYSAQRGGVTILNNVINVNNGEKTVVEVKMPSSGNLNVIVMTLDGNIIKYLQHGRTSKGLHYYRWDGTNKAGNKVARGLYFIRVVGPDIDETRKVMCVKK